MTIVKFHYPLRRQCRLRIWIILVKFAFLPGANEFTVTDEHRLNAKHAYYGMISYIDEKIGNLVTALERANLRKIQLLFLLPTMER